MRPFLGRLIKPFVVFVEFIDERFGGFLLLELSLKPLGDGFQRAGNREGGRREELAQHQRHQRTLTRRQRLEVVAQLAVGFLTEVARELGLEFCAVAVGSNYAPGVVGNTVSHEEVTEATGAASANLFRLLDRVVQLSTHETEGSST